MSVAPTSRRAPCDRRAATLAWTATGALILFTLAAMASIGIFLLVPAALATWWTARRFGTAGAALGLPLGFAATVALLAVLMRA